MRVVLVSFFALSAVLLVQVNAKSFSEVGDCFHEIIQKCADNCKKMLDEDKREAVSKCWKAESENRRSLVRTCASEKGVDLYSNCYKFNRAEHMKLLSSSASVSKFGDQLHASLKKTHECFDHCVEEKHRRLDACQEECADASHDTKDKIHECVLSVHNQFPSATLKSCLSTAFGFQQRLRRFKIHEVIEIDMEK